MRKYKNKNKKELNFLDRFLYKLVIGMTIVVIIMIGNRINLFSLEKVKNCLSENFNILKIVKVFNSPNHTLIPLDEDNSLEVINMDYTNFSIIDGGRRINLNDSLVKNIKVGIVVKIIKEDTYSVYIKGIDGLEYIYRDLENIDLNIYQYVKTGQTIGQAKKDSFDLFVMSKGNLINLDDVYPI